MQDGTSTGSPQQEHAPKSSRWRWLVSALCLLLILVPASLYAWRYLYNPCEVEAVQEGSDSLVIQSKMYDQVYQSAVSGDRTSLDYPVTVLQQVFMDTQAVTVPGCLQSAKGELLSYMETVIYAFRAYGAGEALETVRDLVQRSNEHYHNFTSELKAVQECAPFCVR